MKHPSKPDTKEPVTEEANPLPKPRYSLSQHRMTRCQSDDDGMCYDASVCPQLRDGEPKRSGRHCPLDVRERDEE